MELEHIFKSWVLHEIRITAHFQVFLMKYDLCIEYLKLKILIKRSDFRILFFEKVLESGLIPPLFKNKFLVISPFLITYTYKLFLDVFLYFYWQQYEFMDKKISHNFDIQKVHTVNFTKYIFNWASTPYVSRTYMNLFSAKNISVIFIFLLILAKCQIQYWF